MTKARSRFAPARTSKAVIATAASVVCTSRSVMRCVEGAVVSAATALAVAIEALKAEPRIRLANAWLEPVRLIV